MIALSGVGFVVVFVVTCTLLQVMQWPSTLLLLLPDKRRLFRMYNRWVAGTWAGVIVLTTQWFSPTKLVVSGEPLGPDGNLVLMSNHQTFADWWYLWCLAYNRQKEGVIKIILKSSLKHIPVYGWGMRLFEFVFLRRRWEDDSKHMGKTLAEYAKPTSFPYWLVIFPEGTIIRNESRVKSTEYAEKQKFAPLRHQLLPRVTGLKFCVDKLRSTSECIVDVTIGYQGVHAGQNASEVFTLSSIFLKGRAPPAIHMYLVCALFHNFDPDFLLNWLRSWHIRKFKLADVPTDEKEFAEWTMDRYREKDALLEKFYQTGRFDNVSKTEPIRVRSYLRLLSVYVYAAAFFWLSALALPFLLGALTAGNF